MPPVSLLPIFPGEPPAPFRARVAAIREMARTARDLDPTLMQQLAADTRALVDARSRLDEARAAARKAAEAAHAKVDDLDAAKSRLDQAVVSGDAREVSRWRDAVTKTKAEIAGAEEVQASHGRLIADAKAAVERAEQVSRANESVRLLAELRARRASALLAIARAAESIAATIGAAFQAVEVADAAVVRALGEYDPQLSMIRSSVNLARVAESLFGQAMTDPNAHADVTPDLEPDSEPPLLGSEAPPAADEATAA